MTTATMGDTQSMADFAAAVKLVAAANEVGNGWGKAFVVDVAKALGADLETCKDFLLAAHRAGLIEMSRLDLVQAFEHRKADIEASEITYLNATFHMVRA